MRLKALLDVFASAALLAGITGVFPVGAKAEIAPVYLLVGWQSTLPGSDGSISSLGPVPMTSIDACELQGAKAMSSKRLKPQKGWYKVFYECISTK